MNEYKESLGRNIVDFLRDIGIDPVYGITILMLVVVISYRKDIKKWDELPFWHKGLIVSAFFAAIVASTFSLLQLIGVIDWGE